MEDKSMGVIRQWIERLTDLGKDTYSLNQADLENQDHVHDMRKGAFDKVTLLFAMLGVIPISLGFYMFAMEGRPLMGIVQVAVFLAIVAITRSKRVSYAWRRNLFVFGYYGLSLMLLVLTGPRGTGFVLISAVLALGGILLNKKESLILAIGNVLVFASLTLMLFSGIFDGYGIYEIKDSWLILVVTSQILGVVILFLIGTIYSNLEDQAKHLQRSKAAVEASEERFQLLFNKAPLGYQSLDQDANFIKVNQQWLDTLGYQKDEVIGRWFGDFLCPEDRDAMKERFPKFKEGGRVQTEFAMVRKDQEVIFVEFNGKIGYNDDGSFKQTHCILKDITEQRKVERELIESEERYKGLYEHSGLAISYFSLEGRVVSFNRTAAAYMGGLPEDFQGKPVQSLFNSDLGDLYLQRIHAAADSETSLEYEDKFRIGGRDLCYISTFSKILDGTGRVTGVQIASLDITARKKLEKELTYTSSHDFLTDLNNRRYFEAQLKKLDHENHLPLTIVMADVNGLKLVNDSFGHGVGDRLLTAAAKAIKKGCRKSDTVARIGGDEFAILMPKTDSLRAEALIGRINEFLGDEWVENFVLSISFGYATKESLDQDLDQVFVEAENKMYKQKIFESSSMRSKAIDVIMNSLYEKSERELSHSKRVGWICGKIAEHMGFAPERTKLMQLAGLVHDIGKIGVDEKVLNKAGKLNQEEWEEIQNHPEAGWRILSSVHEFSEIANYVLFHHERWDGTGYPKGALGEEIPLEARIIAVADAFDAMTSQRTYRQPLSVEAANAEIEKYAGTQFDPEVAKIFLQHFAAFKNQVDLTDESNFTTIKESAR